VYHADAIHTSSSTYGTTVDPPGASGPRAFFDVFQAWRADPHSANALLLTEDPTLGDTVCP